MDKERLTELIDSFKAIASLSILAVAENDIEGVIVLNNSLKRIFKLLEKNITDKEFKILDSYRKLLALEYAKLKTKTPDEQLKILRLCIDFDYAENLHSIALAQLFQKEKKYKEAILLAEYLTTVCDSAPPYLVLAKSYRDLKMYDLSIKAYNSYLILNENDKEAEIERDKVFEEMLGLS